LIVTTMDRDHSLLNSWAGAHTALLVEGQSRLSDVIGTDTPGWELSMSTGLLTLNGVRLQCALLGSVEEGTNTWTWSWADETMDADSIAVQRARSLTQFGEESGLWEFVEPSFSTEGIVDLGMTPGATLSLVASPQIMGGAIFSGWSPGRRLYTVVTDPRLTMEAPTAFTAPKHIMGALAYGLGDDRDIVTVYASSHQLGMDDTESGIRLTFEDGSRLDILIAEGHIRHMEQVPRNH